MAKRCQSCGIPLNKDPGGGGTEQGGGKSAEFCSLCYGDGAFLHPEFDVVQMQEYCATQLKNKGMPKLMAWLFTRDIPRLGRWKARAE